MERRKFIKDCAFAGIAGLGFVSLFESCQTTRSIQVVETNNLIKLNLADFNIVKNNKVEYHKYLVLRTETLSYPIVVYRFSENDFKAILLRCTHQGTELNINGDLLTCSAHGSEFSNKGDLLQGPAEQGLKTFQTTIEGGNLIIHLG